MGKGQSSLRQPSIRLALISNIMKIPHPQSKEERYIETVTKIAAHIESLCNIHNTEVPNRQGLDTPAARIECIRADIILALQGNFINGKTEKDDTKRKNS